MFYMVRSFYMKPCALCEIRPAAEHDIVCLPCAKQLDDDIEELPDEAVDRLLDAAFGSA